MTSPFYDTLALFKISHHRSSHSYAKSPTFGQPFYTLPYALPQCQRQSHKKQQSLESQKVLANLAKKCMLIRGTPQRSASNKNAAEDEAKTGGKLARIAWKTEA